MAKNLHNLIIIALAGETFLGGPDAEIFTGGEGIDTVSYVGATDSVVASLANPSVNTGDAAGDVYISIENLTGSAHADILTGDANDNVLDGGADADMLSGGLGNDTYYVDIETDVVIEAGNEGYDVVYASCDYVLSNHIERLVLLDGGVNGTGNGLDNYIVGNGGKNVLTGAGGADTLIGGDGDDVLYGGDGDDRLEGGADNDRLFGDAGNDTLDGGAGSNTLTGGAGNDLYYVRTAGPLGDVINENPAAEGGFDTAIISAPSFKLSDWVGVEVLRADDSLQQAFLLSGNKAANTIVGGAYDDTLQGGGGDDSLSGGAGNDVLNGGAGSDIMDGGSGNDLYYVDSASDQIMELAGGGTDTVMATVSYKLSAYVEKLMAVGASSVKLTGNTAANEITGSSGDDRLSGGLGKDKLKGGLGKDIFVFDTKLSSSNVDKILDFNVKGDTIWLENKYMPKVGKGSLTKPGKLAKSAFWIGPKAHDKDDRIIYDAKKGYLYYDADGNGAGKAALIATLSKNLKMTYADFFII